ncbi:STM4011 family radical SAM protein [Parabacteroides sp. PF5-9]|uniref:STM4011 family radical SAM protein n=1 Tax=Parabacteroides sp. PF5-9 TaxID=1742404 RepID=UPI00247413C7|nr:STM4011 family radical SAM protein [Parabacteroides sp. PF5-9]MDH6358518.1 hydroxymethylpyrimidine pyrophosphatase-like HAD family hydrolase [Parabacteroides sp. PF5-9]
MSTVRNIYFRSRLKSCNYHCSYCSFGKKSSVVDWEKEEQSLRLFYEQISLLTEPVRILFIPYGEGLIHPYYREVLIRLSLLPQVRGISCQTNLSFSPDLFLEQIKELQADRSKIKLWASFHPEMVEPETFVEKVHGLYQSGLDVCVGVVGHKKSKATIALLREQLDKRIYLFINAMQGKTELLTDEDLACFTSLDPFFLFDYRNAKADMRVCSGGRETVFIDHSGDVYPCPRNPLKVGRITSLSSLTEPFCRKERCDCYIAYSNLKNTPLAQMMGEGGFFRIPEKRKVEAMFFDIDGTLTDGQGKIPDSYRDALKLLAGKIPLYLATSLPFDLAKRRLGNLFLLFTGGVFADGGHLCYNGQNEYIPLTPLIPLPEIDEDYYIREYQAENGVYKYVIRVVLSESTEQIRTLLGDRYNIQEKGSVLTIVDAKAGKKNGLLTICSKMNLHPEKVVAIGNSMNDWEMLSVVGYPCGVIEAEKGLRQSVHYILNPDHLPLFFEPFSDGR